MEQFDAVPLIFFYKLPYDLSFTNLFIPLTLTLLFLYLVLLFFSFEAKLIPQSWQYLFETIYFFILDILYQQVGHKGFVYFPFIFAIFLFILACNLLSLVPFGFALTSHIIVIMFLSLSLGLSIFILGFVLHNVTFLRIFIPESPLALLPLLVIIEIFSYILRCFSLAIRLSANILSGHTLVYIIATFLANVLNIKFWLFLISSLLVFFVLILELGVAFLQAYVFTLLVCLYLNDSIKTPGH